MNTRLEKFSLNCFEQMRECPNSTKKPTISLDKQTSESSIRNLESDYVIFIGSDDTHGCCVENPFPSIVEEYTGVRSVNLGCIDARVDAFLGSENTLDFCRKSRLVVMQIMGAEAMSNRLYRVDPRDNKRFIRASKYLKALYPEVDFSQFSTVYELLTALAQAPKEKLFFVLQELHLAWVARMRTLVLSVGSPVLLIWIADHEPYYAETGGTVFRDPFFVDRTMIEELRSEVIGIVEFTSKPNEIQYQTKQRNTPNGSTQFRQHLGVEFHSRVGKELAPIVRRVLECPSITELTGASVVG